MTELNDSPYLINNNLPTRTKNRFFSSEEPPVRKEAILSGGCGKNILTFAMPRQRAEWQARGSVRATVRIAQRFLLLIYRTNPVTGSEAPMSEAMNMRIFPAKPKIRPSWRSRVILNSLSAALAFR